MIWEREWGCQRSKRKSLTLCYSIFDRNGTLAFKSINSLTNFEIRNNYVESAALLELVNSFKNNNKIKFCDIGLNGDLQLQDQILLQGNNAAASIVCYVTILILY